MSQEWFHAKGAEKQGPITSTQLRDLAHTGELKPTDLIWTEGMKEWQKASSVKGLFPARQAVRSSVTGVKPPPLPDDAMDGLTWPPRRQPWFCHWAFLTLTTIVFFPVTLVLVWWKSTYSKRAKWAWTGACGLMWILAVSSSNSKKDGDTAQTPIAQPPKVGDVSSSPANSKTSTKTQRANPVQQGADGRGDEKPSEEDVIRTLVLAASGVAIGAQDPERLTNRPWLRIGPTEFNNLVRQAASVLGCGNHPETRHLLNVTPSEIGEKHGLTILYYDKKRYGRTFVTFSPNNVDGKISFVGSNIGETGYTPFGIVKDNKIQTPFGDLSTEELHRLFDAK